MFESESGENSSSMLENVTSEIFHCPCPQVKKCEPTNVYKCTIVRFWQDVRNVSFDDCGVNCTEGEEVMVLDESMLDSDSDSVFVNVNQNNYKY